MTGFLTKYAFIAVTLAAIAGWLMYQGGKNALRDANETTLERKNEIDNAITSCDELPWFERLQCDE